MYLGCLWSKLSNNRVSCGSSGLISGTASTLVCIHQLQALFLGNMSYPSLPEFRSALSLCIWVPEPQITMVANLGRKRNSLVLSFHMNNVKTTDKNTAWYNPTVNKKCARQDRKPYCSRFFPMPAPFSCFCLCFCFVPAVQNCFWEVSFCFLKVCSYLRCGLYMCEGCFLRFSYVFTELDMSSYVLDSCGFFLRLAQWYLSLKDCVVVTPLYQT